MVPLAALWLPILLSAVVVFIAGSIMHMVLTHHRTDFGKLPDEEKALAALREAGVQPGNYHFPHCGSPKEMGTPEMIEKYKKGPVGLMFVLPSSPPAMPKYLAQWFLFCLVVSIFAAYLAGRTLVAGTDYLMVFRVTGTVAFLGFTAGEFVDSIWKGQKWSTSIKGAIDGLVYALLTGGIFGWLWPS